MALDGAVVGGAFALGGVALQHAFTVLGDRRRAYRDQARELRLQRVSLYTLMIADARRVQRTLKDSSVTSGDRTSKEDRVQTELDRLAESVAAVRLIASAPTTKVVETFEETARSVSRRPPSERSKPEERMRLTPLIQALQRDLSADESRILAPENH